MLARVRLDACDFCKGPLPDNKKVTRFCGKLCRLKREGELQKQRAKDKPTASARAENKLGAVLTDELADRIWEERYKNQEREYYAR